VKSVPPLVETVETAETTDMLGVEGLANSGATPSDIVTASSTTDMGILHFNSFIVEASYLGLLIIIKDYWRD
jgi:hypothetical protein